jgi:hypothetical protein
MHYDKYERFLQKRAALTAWEAHVLSVVGFVRPASSLLSIVR